MHRQYIYTGEFGNLDLEIEQGLNFDNISDVSDDSEYPEEGQWRPLSPEREPDHEDAKEMSVNSLRKAEEKRLEAQARRALAVKLVAQDRIVVRELRQLYSIRAFWRSWIRTIARQPELASRLPGPALHGQDPFVNVTSTSEHLFMEIPDLTAQRQARLAPEIERKVKFLHEIDGWKKRQRKKDVRWAKLDLSVSSRIEIWAIEQRKTIVARTGDYRKADEWFSFKEALTPRILWQRRRVLTEDVLQRFIPGITRQDLENMSVDNFFTLYQTLPETAKQYFLCPGYSPSRIRVPRRNCEWEPDPFKRENRKIQRFQTLGALELYRRVRDQDPSFDLWVEQNKCSANRREQNIREAESNAAKYKATVDRRYATKNRSLASSILTQTSLRTHHQHPAAIRKQILGSHMRPGESRAEQIRRRLRVIQIRNERLCKLKADSTTATSKDE